MTDAALSRPESHYAVLGVAPGSPAREVERAFRELRASRAAGGVREEAFRRAEESFFVLSDPEGRRRHDRQIGIEPHPAWRGGPAAGAALLRAALRALAGGRPGRARVLLEEAVRRAPRDPEARGWLALVQARSGGCLREAERHARFAAAQRPGRPEFLFNLAEICSCAGRGAESRRLRARAWVLTTRALIGRIGRL